MNSPSSSKCSCMNSGKCNYCANGELSLLKRRISNGNNFKKKLKKDKLTSGLPIKSSKKIKAVIDSNIQNKLENFQKGFVDCVCVNKFCNQKCKQMAKINILQNIIVQPAFKKNKQPPIANYFKKIDNSHHQPTGVKKKNNNSNHQPTDALKIIEMEVNDMIENLNKEKNKINSTNFQIGEKEWWDDGLNIYFEKMEIPKALIYPKQLE